MNAKSMHVIKLFIKNNRVLNFAITPWYWSFKNFMFKARKKKFPSMPIGELNVFTKIFSQCRVIVDIGARYDVEYLKIS